MRFLDLYLVSRRADWALASIVATAALAWVLLTLWGNSSMTLIVQVVLPLLPAVVIGVSTGSPFGEAEYTASRSLFSLRLAHLGGLFVCAAIALSLASLGEPGLDTHWVLFRNLAGYTGLACIGTRLVGPAFASIFGWALPLAYVAVIWAVEDGLVWAWAKQPSSEDSAMLIAMVLLTVGLTAILPGGNWRRVSEGDLA